MDVGTRTSGNAVIVSVAGRVDATTAPELMNQLTQLINTGQAKLVMNLEKLEYISSAGLRTILSTAKLINTKHGKFVLAGVSGSVKQVFDISGLTPIFTMATTEAEALKLV